MLNQDKSRLCYLNKSTYILIISILVSLMFLPGISLALRGEDYQGMYYLHGKPPRFGQNVGNLNDVGELRRKRPIENEERYCANWIQFDFGDPVLIGMNGAKNFTIESIYYHIWWRTAFEAVDIGYQVVPSYDAETLHAFRVDYRDSRSYLVGSGYWLTTYKQETKSSGKNIHDFTIKLINFGYVPSVVSGPNNPSFIIINPENDDVLRGMDSDDDTISDYDEMYTYYTDPYYGDTDSDGLLDPEEIFEGEDGLLTDPNNFDTDSDGLMDGVDSDPLVSRYEKVIGDWIITDPVSVSGEYLHIIGDIVVEDGGELTIINSFVKMNTDGEQNQIMVKRGGFLKILNSTLRTDSPRIWFKSIYSNKWLEVPSSIDIYGSAVIKSSVIEYGSEIQIEEGSDVLLDGNDIRYYRHGIEIFDSNPTIMNNMLEPYIGNGMLISHASPVLKNNEIFSYLGSGIVMAASSPTIIGGKITGSSTDLYLTEDSHPNLVGVVFPEGKNIEIIDDLSSVVYANENGDTFSNTRSNNSQNSGRTSIYKSIAVFLIGVISIIALKQIR